jgi:hypothetical protein
MQQFTIFVVFRIKVYGYLRIQLQSGKFQERFCSTYIFCETSTVLWYILEYSGNILVKSLKIVNPVIPY